MLSGIDWLAFLPAAVVLSLVPGANQTLSLRNGMLHGARPAALAVSGRFVAFAVMIVLVAVGLGAVLARSETAFSLLKWVGAAYVVFLGLRTILAAGSAAAEPAAADAPRVAAPVRRLARQELLVAASNPKAILIFAVFLPQFATAEQGAFGQLLALGFVFLLIEVATAGGYAWIGGRIRASGLPARARRRIERGTGVGLLGMGAWLATASRG